MPAEVNIGVRLTAVKKATALLGARAPASARYRAKPAKKVNAPSANSEMGMPPQYFSFNSAA